MHFFFRVSPNPVYRLAFVIKQNTPNLSGLKLVIYNFSQFYGLFVRMASPTHLTVGRLVGFGSLSWNCPSLFCSAFHLPVGLPGLSTWRSQEGES